MKFWKEIQHFNIISQNSEISRNLWKIEPEDPQFHKIQCPNNMGDLIVHTFTMYIYGTYLGQMPILMFNNILIKSWWGYLKSLNKKFPRCERCVSSYFIVFRFHAKKFTWSLNENGYVYAYGTGVTVPLDTTLAIVNPYIQNLVTY